MGTSTDAILAYGYDLGEWNKIQGAGEFGELLNLPWLDDDSDDGYREQAEQILAAKVITVSRGHCENLDLLALAAEPVEHGWDDKLRAACQTLGITPTQEQPGWVLVSYWGG